MSSIKNGDLYTAFEVALSASDLNIVLFTCQQVDPVKVFQESSVVLPQPIILSLIQQLSQNLSEDTELKTRWDNNRVMCVTNKRSFAVIIRLSAGRLLSFWIFSLNMCSRWELKRCLYKDNNIFFFNFLIFVKKKKSFFENEFAFLFSTKNLTVDLD